MSNTLYVKLYHDKYPFCTFIFLIFEVLYNILRISTYLVIFSNRVYKNLKQKQLMHCHYYTSNNVKLIDPRKPEARPDVREE